MDATIAASGSKDDPREPGYFDSIMREISERKLSRSFGYLGMIPLPHVYALLRTSLALINPSRFEGWSNPVEEAKSFGVPMILSDLDVYREQTAGRTMYFGTDDPDSPADHLARVARDAEPSFVRNLVPGFEDRVSTFATDFRHCSQRYTISPKVNLVAGLAAQGPICGFRFTKKAGLKTGSFLVSGLQVSNEHLLLVGLEVYVCLRR